MQTAHINTYVLDHAPRLKDQPMFGPAQLLGRIPAVYNASTLIDDVIARGGGRRPALRTASGDISYNAFLEIVDRIAHGLVRRHGLVPGDPVLIQSPNSPEAMAAWWAVLRAGGVAVSIMPMLRPEEVAKIVSKAKVKLALTSSDLVEGVEAARSLTGQSFDVAALDGPSGLARAMADEAEPFLPVATSRDDPAILAFTSGTTGSPKGCIQFHRDILLICQTFLSEVLRPTEGDVFCCTAPMAFTFGLGASVIFPVAVGGCTALPPKPGYEALADAIDEMGVTVLATAPTAYRVLSRMAGERFASLRRCVSAGEHLSRETFDMWETATGLRLVDGIGSTELMHIFISAAPNDVRPGATGKAVPGYEAAILNDALAPVSAGEVGRLAVRGATGCRYLDDERQKTYVQGGWNLTGDLFRQDEDGYFWFVSRADDLIVSSGYNIAAIEVEQAVLQHTAVKEVAVIGVADPERGQICKAFVVLTEGAHPSDALVSDIQRFTKETIAPYKYPRAIDFVEALPKTHTGKLKRSALKPAATAAVLQSAAS